ncbi:MAG: HlyD family secretion protein [Telmatospirillum sp.]|nr:HlyD family secretion protein [Telmatospirillum sp.]
MGGAALALVVVAAGWGYRWWTEDRFQVTTDDAYVRADYTTVAPKVSGYISEVLVEDNQTVSAGQAVARIDDRDFRNALEQAKADAEAAQATVANILAQIDQQHQMVEQARAAIAVDEAARVFAQQELDRYRDLQKTGYGTVQRAQQAASDIQQKNAALVRDRAALAAAEKEIEVLNTGLAKARAALTHDQAVVAQAELNLSYTTLVAPIGGTVGNRTLRVGQYVQAGTQLMALVPLQSVYVVGNFKETQLTHVHKGQSVDITVDSFPGVVFQGHVDSVAPAAGQEFALLPPDNATGNFTKVVQRIPVKITLDRIAASDRLRPGMSVQPTIDTKEQALADARNPVSDHAVAAR